MNVLILISIIATAAFQNIFRKEYMRRGKSTVLLFNAIASACAAIFLLFISIGNLDFSIDFLPYSLVYAAASICVNLFSILAIATGPLSLTSFFMSYSLLPPMIYGIVFLDEEITAKMIIALVLFFVAAALTNIEKRGEPKKITAKWILFVLLALLGTGFTSIIQKAEQIRFNGSYKNEFMMIAFIIIAVVMVCISLIFERGLALQSIKRTVAFASLTGAASGIINLLIMVLTGLMAASVMFPAISAGGIVAAFLVALIIYKEKLSPCQYVGAALGTIAVILFNI